MEMMTPKHAKPQPAARFSWDPPEDAYEKERIKELQGQLAFANETISKLQEEVAKYSRLMTVNGQRFERILDEKDARIEELEMKIVKLVDAYV